MPEPEPGDGELDGHGRHLGGPGVGLDELAAVREDVVDDSRVDDPRQVVVADHPLVVQRHRLAGLPEPLDRRQARGQRVDHRVVEPEHRDVGLGDDEVLVVARVGDQRRALAVDTRQVMTLLAGVRADLAGLAQLEVQPVVLVELGGLRVSRPGAVQRVEVQPRRPALHELRRGHVLAELDVGLVQRQVVVDELAEVGVAGREVARAAVVGRARPGDHRVGDLLGHGRAEGRALRPAPAEPERWLARGGGGAGVRTAAGLLADHPFALDEERLGPVAHRHPSKVKRSRR